MTRLVPCYRVRGSHNDPFSTLLQGAGSHNNPFSTLIQGAVAGGAITTRLVPCYRVREQ